MKLKDLIKAPPAEGYIKKFIEFSDRTFCSGGHSLLSY